MSYELKEEVSFNIDKELWLGNLRFDFYDAVPNPGNLHIIKAESEHFNGCADHSAQLQMGPARVALIRRQGEIPSASSIEATSVDSLYSSSFTYSAPSFI